MLALCLILLPSYYAQNYAGIIGSSLPSITDTVAIGISLSQLETRNKILEQENNQVIEGSSIATSY